jgi:topoisomerase-4 subunit A
MTQGGITFDGLFKEVQKGETIVKIFAFEEVPTGNFIVFTKQGAVKITEWSECQITRTSCQVMKLKDGDEVISVCQDEEDKIMFFVTEKGVCLRADKDVPVQGRVAGGVKGMDVSDDDAVVYAGLIDDDFTTECVIVTSFGTFKKVITGTVTKTSRARKGVKIAELGDPKMNECVVYASCVSPEDKSLLSVVDRLGVIYYVNTNEIPQDSRTTKGRTLPNIGVCQPQDVYCVRR